MTATFPSFLICNRQKLKRYDTAALPTPTCFKGSNSWRGWGLMMNHLYREHCRRVAAWRRYCAVAAVRLREQHARARSLQTFKAWQQVASYGAGRRAQMRKAVKRMALSHQAAFFHGWQARVHNKQVSLHLHHALWHVQAIHVPFQS